MRVHPGAAGQGGAGPARRERGFSGHARLDRLRHQVGVVRELHFCRRCDGSAFCPGAGESGASRGRGARPLRSGRHDDGEGRFDRQRSGRGRGDGAGIPSGFALETVDLAAVASPGPPQDDGGRQRGCGGWRPVYQQQLGGARRGWSQLARYGIASAGSAGWRCGDCLRHDVGAGRGGGCASGYGCHRNGAARALRDGGGGPAGCAPRGFGLHMARPACAAHAGDHGCVSGHARARGGCIRGGRQARGGSAIPSARQQQPSVGGGLGPPPLCALDDGGCAHPRMARHDGACQDGGGRQRDRAGWLEQSRSAVDDAEL